MILKVEELHFLQVYVIKDKNQKFLKIFFNEEGHRKIKEAQEFFGHVSDLRRPEGAVQIQYEDMCLFHQRYEEVYAKGRIALITLLGLRYDPHCINSFPIDVVNKLIKESHEKEGMSNVGEFRRKYFPGVRSLSSVVNRFCFEEVEFVDGIFTLKVNPVIFKEELKKKIEYRKTLFKELDGKFKEPWSDPKHLSEFEDDVRTENQRREIRDSEVDSESSEKPESAELVPTLKKESPIVMCFSRFNRIVPSARTNLVNLSPSEDEKSEEPESPKKSQITGFGNDKIPECEERRIPRSTAGCEERSQFPKDFTDRCTDGLIPEYEDVESDS